MGRKKTKRVCVNRIWTATCTMSIFISKRVPSQWWWMIGDRFLTPLHLVGLGSECRTEAAHSRSTSRNTKNQAPFHHQLEFDSLFSHSAEELLTGAVAARLKGRFKRRQNQEALEASTENAKAPIDPSVLGFLRIEKGKGW